MRKLVKKIAYPILKPIAAWYFRKPRTYRYEGLTLTILPSVFHPGTYLSTTILAEFLNTLELQGKRLLELGAGSGLISFIAAKKGAVVTASDINPEAIRGLELNAEQNGLSINVVHSDLFSAIQPNDFDLIVINPPYYPKAPNSPAEAAFYCGDNFEYFERLFDQLANYSGSAYMILSEDCDLKSISDLATQYGIQLLQVYETKKMQERNYIFQFEQP